jgi:hypothetical protein
VQGAVVPQVCKHTLEEIAGKRQGHYIAFKAPEALFSNIFKLLSDPTAPSANAFKGMMQDGTRIIAFIRTTKTKRCT